MDRDFGLTPDERELVGLVRKWADDRAAPNAARYEEERRFPRDLFRELGEMGFGGIPYEERFGGGGQSYRLTGSKRFISHAGEAETYLVMARTGGEGPGGISAFVVERGAPGFDFGKVEDKMGWQASPMRELLFEDCEVPLENLVGEEGT